MDFITDLPKYLWTADDRWGLSQGVRDLHGWAVASIKNSTVHPKDVRSHSMVRNRTLMRGFSFKIIARVRTDHR